MQKPFKSYNGGKEAEGVYQRIINVIPPHDIYIDAFLGNSAILRFKKPAFTCSICIDLDSTVIDSWQKLSIPGCTFINTDSIQWLSDFLVPAAIFKSMQVRILIYLDPPYPLACRKSPNKLYYHEMTDADHINLLTVARSIQANVIISSYSNEIYNDLLKDWNSFSFPSLTRSGAATEQLWFNYPYPSVLHDYRYLGDTFRQRERLKLIIRRSVSKFNLMPDLERNAILSHLKP